MVELKIRVDELPQSIERSLRDAGFDLVEPRPLTPIRSELAQRGIDWCRAANPLGLIVGNTAALWPRFLDALRTRADLRESDHPLDSWIEEAIDAALLGAKHDARAYFAHRRHEQGFLPLQRWAQMLGILALSPSHLSVHPKYGPWLGLRAIVLVDVETDPRLAAMPALEPCGTCVAPCREPFLRAIQQAERQSGTEQVAAHWQAWLKVRDACPVGRDFRYSDPQIRYHYRRDRSVLV